MGGKCAVMLDDGSCKVEFKKETSSGGIISSGNRPTDVEIKGSVGLNGQNNFQDVYKIQYALNKVPPIDGGPPSPIKIDGKCSQETFKTIQNFEQKQFGLSGITSRIEPGKSTHLKLKEVSGRYNVFPALPLDLVNDAWLFAGMMQHIPFTKTCINAAMTKISSAQIGGMFSEEAINLLNRHFALDKHPAKQSAMQQIYEIYGFMLNVLNRPDNFFTLDTDNSGETISTVAFARLGGFFSKETDGRIVFRRGTALATGIQDFAAFIIIHELRHFVERQSEDGHFGKGWVTDSGMQRLTPWERIFNCDTYAGFALEAKHGVMERPGWVRTTKFR
ncbi:MAG: hypothetical protein K1X72_15505 [Pyrinomonadaceae bacterium]|nr:hypothetical protein [Pyrinomonadaceae bacterium]